MNLTENQIKYIAKHFNMELNIVDLDENLVYTKKYEEESATDMGEFRLYCDVELHFRSNGDAYKHYIECIEIWDSEEELPLSDELKKELAELLAVQLYQNNVLN